MKSYCPMKRMSHFTSRQATSSKADKMHSPSPEISRFRSYSDDGISRTLTHSSRPAKVLNPLVPSDATSGLSQLICSLCGLPMKQPTTLPCQHTFCLNCIQKQEKYQASSLPTSPTSSLLQNGHREITIQCHQCSHVFRLKSLSDLQENRSMELLINTLLCEQCRQLCPSNKLDACSYCYDSVCSSCYETHVQRHMNDLETNRKPIKSPPTDTKPPLSSSKSASVSRNHQNENKLPPKTNATKKKLNSFRDVTSSSRAGQPNSTVKGGSALEPSPPSKRGFSFSKPSRRKQLTVQANIDLSTAETEVPTTPFSQFMELNTGYMDVMRHIQQCKHRQLELDRSVQKIAEALIKRVNETTQDVSQYWSYCKQLFQNRFRLKSNRSFLVDYLANSCCWKSNSQRQIESYIEKHVEIKAALDTLSKTLTNVIERHSRSTVNRLFAREEQTTIRVLKHRLESLHSTYSEARSIIQECITVYDSRLTATKETNLEDLNVIARKWSDIVKEDYPSLIKQLSDDFISIPTIENVLLQMLNNMTQRCLSIDNAEALGRTSSS